MEAGVLEKFRGETFHKKTSAEEKDVGTDDKSRGDEEFVWFQKGEIEEIAGKWNEDSEADDGETGKKQSDTEKIKGSGDAKNEEKINRKSDDKRGGDELGAGVAEVASDD